MSDLKIGDTVQFRDGTNKKGEEVWKVGVITDVFKNGYLITDKKVQYAKREENVKLICPAEKEVGWDE